MYVCVVHLGLAGRCCGLLLRAGMCNGACLPSALAVRTKRVQCTSFFFLDRGWLEVGGIIAPSLAFPLKKLCSSSSIMMSVCASVDVRGGVFAL